MVPEKRQLDLIEAYRSILPNGWQLAIAGRLTDDPYSVSVREAARKAGVVLTGFLKGAPLEQLYSHAGAFVLPSSHEGLPIAMLEALSYGLPVLASDIPANLAVGLEPTDYFPLGNIPALAKALHLRSQLPPDPSARSSRRRWVADRYDWNRIARQTYTLYETTLQARK
jgi:glycosyltransferase involved in cell wall biosynthesis